ncbi:MAG: M23 family metallopeptidase, partial [Alphaproteobacteria bacterium]|nr:M23 family metallopeptidase [Alphaproteobacteria bacterium]
GKTIMIDHGLGLYTIYVHLNNINVYQGEFVQQSDIIGNVGSTGRATGPHLHWGVYVLNARLNPEAVLRANTPIFK